MDFSYLMASEVGEDSRGKNTRWQVILRKNNQKQIIIVRDAVRECFLANLVISKGKVCFVVQILQ